MDEGQSRGKPGNLGSASCFAARKRFGVQLFFSICIFFASFQSQAAAADSAIATSVTDGFPRPLNTYPDRGASSVTEILKERIQAEPFNLVVTAIFLLAVAHTFLAPKFTRLSHALEAEHQRKLNAGSPANKTRGERDEVSFRAEICHFLGEVEAVFGIWTIPLL